MNADDLAALDLDPTRVAAAARTEWAYSRWLAHGDRPRPRRAVAAAVRAVALFSLVRPDLARRAASAVVARPEALTSPSYPILVAIAPSSRATEAWSPELAEDVATAAATAVLVRIWSRDHDVRWLDVGSDGSLQDDLDRLIDAATGAGPTLVGRLHLPLDLWIAEPWSVIVRDVFAAALRATARARADAYHWRHLQLTIAPIEPELALAGFLTGAEGEGLLATAAIETGQALFGGDHDVPVELSMERLPPWWFEGEVPW